MIKVGITERGDAGLDLTWKNKLHTVNAAILITKNPHALFAELVRQVVNEEYKLIVHVTCTGFGGTPLEPNVPAPEAVYHHTLELMEKSGLTASNIVLRTDPIIPTTIGLETWHKVANIFSDTGIKRLRYSYLDLYNHVNVRFREANLRLPYDTKNPPLGMQEYAESYIDTVCKELGYEPEACGEFTKHKIGCISAKDFEVWGFNTDEITGRSGQRNECLCCANKTELLADKKRCLHNCLYCYWRD